MTTTGRRAARQEIFETLERCYADDHAALPPALQRLVSPAAFARFLQEYHMAYWTPFEALPDAVTCPPLTEERYYRELLQAGRAQRALFPYPLMDCVVRVTAILPFDYYMEMLLDLTVVGSGASGDAAATSGAPAGAADAEVRHPSAAVADRGWKGWTDAAMSTLSAGEAYEAIPGLTALDLARVLGVGRHRFATIFDHVRSSLVTRHSRTFARRSEVMPTAVHIGVTVDPFTTLQPCVGVGLNAAEYTKQKRNLEAFSGSDQDALIRRAKTAIKELVEVRASEAVSAYEASHRAVSHSSGMATAAFTASSAPVVVRAVTSVGRLLRQRVGGGSIAESQPPHDGGALPAHITDALNRRAHRELVVQAAVNTFARILDAAVHGEGLPGSGVASSSSEEEGDETDAVAAAAVGPLDSFAQWGATPRQQEAGGGNRRLEATLTTATSPPMTASHYQRGGHRLRRTLDPLSKNPYRRLYACELEYNDVHLLVQSGCAVDVALLIRSDDVLTVTAATHLPPGSGLGGDGSARTAFGDAAAASLADVVAFSPVQRLLRAVLHAAGPAISIRQLAEQLPRASHHRRGCSEAGRRSDHLATVREAAAVLVRLGLAQVLRRRLPRGFVPLVSTAMPDAVTLGRGPSERGPESSTSDDALETSRAGTSVAGGGASSSSVLLHLALQLLLGGGGADQVASYAPRLVEAASAPSSSRPADVRVVYASQGKIEVVTVLQTAETAADDRRTVTPTGGVGGKLRAIPESWRSSVKNALQVAPGLFGAGCVPTSTLDHHAGERAMASPVFRVALVVPEALGGWLCTLAARSVALLQAVGATVDGTSIHSLPLVSSSVDTLKRLSVTFLETGRLSASATLDLASVCASLKHLNHVLGTAAQEAAMSHLGGGGVTPQFGRAPPPGSFNDGPPSSMWIGAVGNAAPGSFETGLRGPDSAVAPRFAASTPIRPDETPRRHLLFGANSVSQRDVAPLLHSTFPFHTQHAPLDTAAGTKRSPSTVTSAAAQSAAWWTEDIRGTLSKLDSLSGLISALITGVTTTMTLPASEEATDAEGPRFLVPRPGAAVHGSTSMGEADDEGDDDTPQSTHNANNDVSLAQSVAAARHKLTDASWSSPAAIAPVSIDIVNEASLLRTGAPSILTHFDAVVCADQTNVLPADLIKPQQDSPLVLGGTATCPSHSPLVLFMLAEALNAGPPMVLVRRGAALGRMPPAIGLDGRASNTAFAGIRAFVLGCTPERPGLTMGASGPALLLVNELLCGAPCGIASASGGLLLLRTDHYTWPVASVALPIGRSAPRSFGLLEAALRERLMLLATDAMARVTDEAAAAERRRAAWRGAPGPDSRLMMDPRDSPDATLAGGTWDASSTTRLVEALIRKIVGLPPGSAGAEAERPSGGHRCLLSRVRAILGSHEWLGGHMLLELAVVAEFVSSSSSCGPTQRVQAVGAEAAFDGSLPPAATVWTEAYGWLPAAAGTTAVRFTACGSIVDVDLSLSLEALPDAPRDNATVEPPAESSFHCDVIEVLSGGGGTDLDRQSGSKTGRVRCGSSEAQRRIRCHHDAVAALAMRLQRFCGRFSLPRHVLGTMGHDAAAHTKPKPMPWLCQAAYDLSWDGTTLLPHVGGA